MIYSPNKKRPRDHVYTILYSVLPVLTTGNGQLSYVCSFFEITFMSKTNINPTICTVGHQINSCHFKTHKLFILHLPLFRSFLFFHSFLMEKTQNTLLLRSYLMLQVSFILCVTWCYVMKTDTTRVGISEFDRTFFCHGYEYIFTEYRI